MVAMFGFTSTVCTPDSFSALIAWEPDNTTLVKMMTSRRRVQFWLTRVVEFASLANTQSTRADHEHFAHIYKRDFAENFPRNLSGGPVPDIAASRHSRWCREQRSAAMHCCRRMQANTRLYEISRTEMTVHCSLDEDVINVGFVESQETRGDKVEARVHTVVELLALRPFSLCKKRMIKGLRVCPVESVFVWHPWRRVTHRLSLSCFVPQSPSTLLHKYQWWMNARLQRNLKKTTMTTMTRKYSCLHISFKLLYSNIATSYTRL